MALSMYPTILPSIGGRSESGLGFGLLALGVCVGALDCCPAELGTRDSSLAVADSGAALEPSANIWTAAGVPSSSVAIRAVAAAPLCACSTTNSSPAQNTMVGDRMGDPPNIASTLSFFLRLVIQLFPQLR